MYSNFDKRSDLARQTQIVQALRRIRRGIGAVRGCRVKLAFLVCIWALLGIAWAARHPMMGYAPGTLLAPVLDALTVVLLLFLTAALTLALLWAWGGPWQAGRVQDNLSRIGLVNSAGEPPTLLSLTTNPSNPQVKDYTFYTCGIPVSVWLDCADKIQSALNGSIADISYGEDNQTITLSLAPPATKWPERIVWYDRNVSQENFVLTLGESQLGPVTVDLRTNAHLLLGGVTGSGKTVLLKVLLRQAIDKGARVYIADFKGGVDFKLCFRENCYMSYDMDATLETLAEFEKELENRKTLLRDTNLKMPRASSFSTTAAARIPAQPCSKRTSSPVERIREDTMESKNTIAYLAEKYGLFLTVSNLTEILQVSRPVIDNLILTGDLPCAKVGKQYRIDLISFLKWWNNRVGQEQKNILIGCLPS